MAANLGVGRQLRPDRVLNCLSRWVVITWAGLARDHWEALSKGNFLDPVQHVDDRLG